MIGKRILKPQLINHKLERITDNIFGNILESLIGSVYIDLGYNESKKFIIKNIINKTNNKTEDQNFKSMILEWSQKKNKKIKFINKKQKGADHQKEYLIELHVEGKKVSEAWAGTKKVGEQKSSEIAIKIVT